VTKEVQPNQAPSLFVTTPIYYVNDKPHIGHAYTTVIADVLARYARLFGGECFFLTGTDEHGQKVAEAAAKRVLEPQAHVDDMVVNFQEAWRELQIEPDIFMRTTFGFHKEVVQQCLSELYERGEIYEHEYEGWYSVSEEIFYTDKDLVDGKSPAGKPVQRIREKNYFFRMSAYQERLINHIEENPYFIFPQSRRNEVLGFLRQPLQDLCISRPKSRLSWGIELPFDKDFVTYVWFDALLNYTSALGHLSPDQDKQDRFKRLWPSAVHLIGKDILITHAVYWPTMLMALGLSLPKQIVAHGWWLTAPGAKMSKSEGKVVSPLEVKDLVGVDAFRYSLVRGMRLGNDALFSLEEIVTRINADLANNLGNLLSRVVGIVQKHYEGVVPQPTAFSAESVALHKEAVAIAQRVKHHVDLKALDSAVEEVVRLLDKTNQYITAQAPWKVLKESKGAAADSLYTTLEILRIAAILLSPVMPAKMKLLLDTLGWRGERAFQQASQWGELAPGTVLEKPEVLFPKIDLAVL
jgi:methionyl-tRNA synthetase